MGVSDDQLAIRLTVRLQRDGTSRGSNGRVCACHYVYGCVCVWCVREVAGVGVNGFRAVCLADSHVKH